MYIYMYTGGSSSMPSTKWITKTFYNEMLIINNEME